MKHILFILPYLNLGGTEKQAYSLIEKLTDTYKISLLAPPPNNYPSNIYPLPSGKLTFLKVLQKLSKA